MRDAIRGDERRENGGDDVVQKTEGSVRRTYAQTQLMWRDRGRHTASARERGKERETRAEMYMEVCEILR